MHRVLLVLAALLAAVALVPARAAAAGGRYTIVGGTQAEQATVRNALAASAFNWSAVPATVTIKIARGIESEAVPGEIRLDADLLDAGRFSWGIVQHEYAHQVDFYLLDDAKRATLLPQLGASSWWPGAGTTTAHGDIGGERFASTLAWAFWTSTDNSLRPANARDEAGGMAPTAFREAVARMIAGGTPIVPVVGSPVPAKAPALSKQTKR